MDRAIEQKTLAGFASRVAGSDAERRAALALRDRLRADGRAAVVEPFRFHQRWALAQAIAAAVAVIGSVLSVSAPPVGVALVALAAVSSMLEATGRLELLARLTGTRASQNVSAPPGNTRPGLLVLAAAYDAPRASLFARAAERLADPWRVLATLLSAVLLCCVLRLLGVDGDLLTAVQLIPTLLLLAAVPLLVDAELAPVGDGAAEAAGVAVALTLADRLATELEQLDVWLVLAGAGGSLGAGMRAWRRRHRQVLNARPTVTIEVGAPVPETAAEVVEVYAELARGLDAEIQVTAALRP